MNEKTIRKVIKKRNYGFIKIIDAYQELIVKTVHTPAELRLIAQEYALKRGYKLNQSLENVQRINEKQHSRENRFSVAAPALFHDVRKHAANKVITNRGTALTFKLPTYAPVIQRITIDNLKYVRNLTQLQKDVVITRLADGLKQGLTFNEITVKIMEEVNDLTLNRAKTIAITEISRAHAQTQRDLMRENNIGMYRWITARDKVVCDVCKEFERNSPYRTDDANSPLPVRESHPRCRCVVVAETR